MSKRPGWCGYADILKSVKDAPGTTVELAERFDMGLIRMRIILNRFHDMKMIHVGSWRKRLCHQGPAVAVFHFGNAPDVPGLRGGRPRTPRKTTAQHEQTQMVNIMRQLVHPITKQDLAAAVGSQYTRVSAFVNHLHTIGLCHIHAWCKGLSGGTPSSMYQLGHGEDAKRPAALTRKELDRNAWARRKARNHMQRLIRATAASNASVFAYAERA